ncbi:unnamed protein product [Amoebophrya sp. A25]|nr:unnamed protein product [Amoebophrya sp. A25]|eukprot:GSA25T00005148001.1
MVSRDSADARAKKNAQYVDLKNRPELLDSWQLRYFYEPDSYKVTREMEKKSHDKETLYREFQRGDHHRECFYQGSVKPSKMFIVTANYTLDQSACAHNDRGWAEDCVDVFSQFGSRVFFINMEDAPRSQLYGQEIEEVATYPWRCVIAGSAVEMDDALRFCCSLFIPQKPSCRTRYYDIWSAAPSVAMKRGRGRPRGATTSSASSSSRQTMGNLRRQVAQLQTENANLREENAKLHEEKRSRSTVDCVSSSSEGTASKRQKM